MATAAHTTTPRNVMSRAWEIFRAKYNYPRIRFASIGRACFAWALKAAWAEVREAVRLAAIPLPALAARVDVLDAKIWDLQFVGWGTNVAKERDRINAERLPLIAELGRRPVRDVLQLAA